MNPHELSATLNGVNLVVSMGLLALGVVLIVFGFRLPDKKCTSTRNKNCVTVMKYDKNGNTSLKDNDFQTLRLVALITGFLLIIPLGLNVAEMVADYLPGGDAVSGLASSIGSAVNQASYRGPSKGAYNMKSKHHGMHHGMHHAMRY